MSENHKTNEKTDNLAEAQNNIFQIPIVTGPEGSRLSWLTMTKRSATSFRRQGSSGLVWDDKLVTASGELIQLGNPRGESTKIDREEGSRGEKSKLEVSVPSKTDGSMERSRSNRGFRTGKVSPAIEPPSPKVSACGFCSAFGKNEKSNRRPKTGKRKM
ncbi:hypothetical protein RND71_029575 [Anisodus tanguticus]|uniref:Uncharacterized protein n=1 Tax=Anisodus tanguticus TaxID=243964 RepID=A0AAE1RG56_9SOLA|nr:hypothetical protein RND71_029575 [Anisodus tanguticus]